VFHHYAGQGSALMKSVLLVGCLGSSLEHLFSILGMVIKDANIKEKTAVAGAPIICGAGD
jgi:hypothetical protein